ncbi:MAG: diphthine synthase [Methanolinea sp.]|nr:diphthine synthase [Methanolinea sp.]
MLAFIGLGLYDLEDISVKGLSFIRSADSVLLEAYTSRLMGSSPGQMEQFYGKQVRILQREEVEQDPGEILNLAGCSKVAFLTGGDPMVSTTHMDLRIRAANRGIPTAIIHGSSISSAVCGLSGLQNYRFGKSCSLPFPRKNWFPLTPAEVVAGNLSHNLHTLVYLDIQEDRCMSIPEAVRTMGEIADKIGLRIPLYVGIARAGSSNPFVMAGTAADLIATDFGPPLHILVVPGPLHVVEREYLEMFAGL